ncbi:hypothetical protein NEHOM01_1757 [Nematocida homosporus]|uniref:uncharacterized protein n=1 Tax=Nematocida homosporus TaxID=1912981 RepID=UPI00221F2CA3|nr:uncharacterized protein NEHOM01_1757 [Nematocida homosporus]KAI5186862.1 hypothetical protein NEHOM01_1757 [Nematocida homosporus]
MDALLRGLKQMGTGLRFTIGQELLSTSLYIAYKGRYKEHKVTIFKYKGKWTEEASLAFPLLKNITDPMLPKVFISQLTSSAFFVVTERLESFSNSFPIFQGFTRKCLADLNKRLGKAHGISIGLSSGVSDWYFTMAGRPVIAGTLPVFIGKESNQMDVDRVDRVDRVDDVGVGSSKASSSKASSGKAGSGKASGSGDGGVGWETVESNERVGEIVALDEGLNYYRGYSVAEQGRIHDLIRVVADDLPPEYSTFVANVLLEYIKGAEGEAGLAAARALLLLNPVVPGPAMLFAISTPGVRVIALRGLKEMPEAVSYVFSEFCDGFLLSDSNVRMETISAVPEIISGLNVKQREKVLVGLGALTKKGRSMERVAAADVVLDGFVEFLECATTLYGCLLCMMQSSEVGPKRTGIRLASRLLEMLDPRAMVMEVIPVVAAQCLVAEVAGDAAEVLVALATRTRREAGRIKADWRVPGIGVLGRAAPIKADPKLVAQQKKPGDKKAGIKTTPKKKAEKKAEKKSEKPGWDNHEW